MRCAVALSAFFALITSISSFGQTPNSRGNPAYAYQASRTAPQASLPISAILDWTPPELVDLSTQASSRTSFAFDRSMLDLIGGIEGGNDPELRRAWAKLDGVSVHVLRFGPAGVPNEPAVEALRAAYHLRGLKHLVTSTRTGGPLHSRTTDVWLVLDGANVEGAVILGQTARSVTLVTVKGDISGEDLLHLRGHFGIPRLDQDGPQTSEHEPYTRGTNRTENPEDN